MGKIELPYVYPKVITRGGKTYTYYYFRRGAFLKRLPDINSPAFSAEYQRLVHRKDALPEPGAGTLAALIKAYRGSPEYGKLADSTKRNREAYFKRMEATYGAKQVTGLATPKVYEIRDSMQATPGAADNYISTLSALMEFARKRGWRQDNPCRGVERLGDGTYDPWPDDVLAKALAAATPMLRRAILLHYYTGQRISDVCKMTRHHIRGGQIRVVQQKTGKELWIPIHAALASELADGFTDSIYLIYNRYRKPFKPATLRERLERLMEDIGHAGEYVFHGLRKNAVNALLEVGCTTFEVASITGQSPQMVEHYAKRVRQQVLASAAIKKWESGKKIGKTPKGNKRSPA